MQTGMKTNYNPLFTLKSLGDDLEAVLHEFSELRPGRLNEYLGYKHVVACFRVAND
jgi:hypothetical protein